MRDDYRSVVSKQKMRRSNTQQSQNYFRCWSSKLAEGRRLEEEEKEKERRRIIRRQGGPVIRKSPEDWAEARTKAFEAAQKCREDRENDALSLKARRGSLSKDVPQEAPVCLPKVDQIAKMYESSSRFRAKMVPVAPAKSLGGKRPMGVYGSGRGSLPEVSDGYSCYTESFTEPLGRMSSRSFNTDSGGFLPVIAPDGLKRLPERPEAKERPPALGSLSLPPVAGAMSDSSDSPLFDGAERFDRSESPNSGAMATSTRSFGQTAPVRPAQASRHTVFPL
jgi:hypothetical protein